MDNSSLFIIIVAGVAIGEYLAQIMLHKTAHFWVDQDDDE